MLRGVGLRRPAGAAGGGSLNDACDGYELYRLLKDGGPQSLQVNGSTYTLQFEGVKTGAHNWLKVTDAKGESIRLSQGWSTEACWNTLTTLETGRWANPIGKWRDPGEWSEPKACR